MWSPSQWPHGRSCSRKTRSPSLNPFSRSKSRPTFAREPTFSWPMMSGAPRSGSLYWLTSVPQKPAISTLRRAASEAMSGRSNSRSAVVDGPTLRAASVFPVATMPADFSPAGDAGSEKTRPTLRAYGGSFRTRRISRSGCRPGAAARTVSFALRPGDRDLRRGGDRARGERVLVGARAVDRRHRHTDLPEVHGELAAVVIPVVQHDRAQYRADRDRHDLPVAIHHAPHLREVGFVQSPKNLARLLETLVESRNQLGGARRARLLELRHRKRRDLRDLGDRARDRRDVQRELTERHRPVVRLPAQTIVGDPLEDAPGRLRFLFEFLQQEFDG